MLQSWSQIFGTLKCCSTDPIIHKLKVMLEEIICSYLPRFLKSHGQMVRFSIKPGNQTDKTESPNLVNKTGLTKSKR